MIAPPKSPEAQLEALIRQARARQLRRRLIGAAAVAVVTATGLSVYGWLGGGRLTQTPVALGGTPPLCRAGQLAGSAGWQGATQSMLGGVSLKNTSGVACSLPGGIPRLSISMHGKQLRIQQRKWPYRLRGGPAHVLWRGNEAVVYTQWWNWCGGSLGSGSPVVRLSFADGLQVSAPVTRDWGIPVCNAVGGAGSTSFIYVSRSDKPN